MRIKATNETKTEKPIQQTHTLTHIPINTVTLKDRDRAETRVRLLHFLA